MCNCIKETTELLQNKIKEDVEEKTNVVEWKEVGRYSHIGWSFNGGDTKIGMPFIATYVRRKVNGEPEKKDTTIKTTIYPTYCPFCGVQLKESNEK